MMYFYVDESGHTGPNLFDHDQPFLYYGTLTSRVNLDVLAPSYLVKARDKLGVTRLHANEIGNGGLADIASTLISIQKRFDLRFDFYRLKKIDHAVICFFDQVFDQGMNPAVPWTAYWTPLRYPLLLRLSTLFDEELMKAAWSARLMPNNDNAEEILKKVCDELIRRVPSLPDQRTREIVGDALRWTVENTRKISYNVANKADAVSMMPNAIGFQSVMAGIAQRLQKDGRKAIGITVDRQSQFNKEQRRLSDWYGRLSGAQHELGPGLPIADYRGMPNTEISFSSGEDSAGLELVDIYLWIFKRSFESKDLAGELSPIVRRQLVVGRTDEISLNAINDRWEGAFRELSEKKLTDGQIEDGKKLMELQEARRKEAFNPPS